MYAKNLTPGPKDVVTRREYTLRDLTDAASILIIDTHLANTRLAMKDDGETLDYSKPFFTVNKEDAIIEFIHADFTQKVELVLDREDGSCCLFKDVMGCEHHLRFYKGYDLELEDIQPKEHPPYELQLVDLLVEISSRRLHMRLGREPGIFRDAGVHGNEQRGDKVVFIRGVYSEGVLTQPDHLTVSPDLITCDLFQPIAQIMQDPEKRWHSAVITDVLGQKWDFYWKSPN